MAGSIQHMMSVNGLEAAARMADIESLYRVITQDLHVLEHIDSVPFVETPLHVAASVNLPGHTQFAIEIMILKPSFALKLNLQGLTPIHLALQNGCHTMALRLVYFNKDLVRAKMRGGLTPLHLATQYGDIGLLAEFLKVCPDSIEDETVTGETALHLAVKNNFEAFEFLIQWIETEPLQLKRNILNCKDEDGNTILHIVALNNATEMRSGSTFLYRSWSFYGKIVQFIIGKPMTKENRNTYLIVATLVATTTYQAALSPPGGFHQYDALGTNHTHTHLPFNSSISEGKSVMSYNDFKKYMDVNMSAFLASTATIMVMLPKRFSSFLLYFANLLLIYSFYLSINIISPPDYTPILSEKNLWFVTVWMIITMAWTSIFAKGMNSFPKAFPPLHRL